MTRQEKRGMAARRAFATRRSASHRERVIAAARGGIQAILCITKIDLADAASADGRGIEEVNGLLAGWEL